MKKADADHRRATADRGNQQTHHRLGQPALTAEMAAAAAKIEAAIDKLQAAQQSGDFTAQGAGAGRAGRRGEGVRARRRTRRTGAPTPVPDADAHRLAPSTHEVGLHPIAASGLGWPDHGAEVWRRLPDFAARLVVR